MSQKDLIDKVFSGEAELNDPLSKFIGPKPGVVGIGDTVAAARKLLENDESLLVLEDGEPIGVITRLDILNFLSQ